VFQVALNDRAPLPVLAGPRLHRQVALEVLGYLEPGPVWVTNQEGLEVLDPSRDPGPLNLRHRRCRPLRAPAPRRTSRPISVSTMAGG
jgi:hypothetical protein